jgi:hypothetical protein
LLSYLLVLKYIYSKFEEFVVVEDNVSNMKEEMNSIIEKLQTEGVNWTTYGAVVYILDSTAGLPLDVIKEVFFILLSMLWILSLTIVQFMHVDCVGLLAITEPHKSQYKVWKWLHEKEYHVHWKWSCIQKEPI